MKINRVIEEELSQESPPLELCTAALVFPFDAEGRVVLATVLKRGVDLPGGHVEPGETLEQAVQREAREECGLELDELVQVGFRRIVVNDPPPNYKYPTPVSYQVFFAARVVGQGQVEMPEECGDPVTLTFTQALEQSCIQRHLDLFVASRKAMT